MKLIFKKGFTLVELLVVISIIGILAAVATANLLTAQKQARDSRRISDLEGAQTALETYYAESQVYPLEAEINDAFDSGARPVDPKDSGIYVYSWLTDTDSYCLCATLESKVGNADTVGTSDSCSWDSAGTYFCVQNRQ